MVLQSEVFPDFVRPVVVRDEHGQSQSVSADLFQPPVATHLSLGMLSGQMTVTQTNAGYAFRRELLPASAQELAAQLLAGIPASWTLEWTNPDDMSDDERTNLMALLVSFPEDAVGSIEVTITLESGSDCVAVLCPVSPDAPSYAITGLTGVPILFEGIQLGEYEVYGYNPSSTEWGISTGGSIILAAGDIVTADVVCDQPGPSGIPCYTP
jgi:hypothetical protein